ncbi:MAG: putative lipopolysaccharide heptosyltransferase III [Deltaproteobacteria bacterium]|nr:putative lipopolysaccharide heptosyltransferase III [Deltaproteobacteria bacterium]
MAEYSRILVIKLKQPGDVLVSTPVLAALKEAWPEARVSYLVRRGTEEMLADHPLLDGLYAAERGRGSWRESWRLIRELRRQRFDLALELSGGDRGAFFAWASGAGERIGFARARQPFWQRCGLFTRLLPRPPARLHMVEHDLEAVRALGVSPRSPRLQFFWNREAEAKIQAWLADRRLSPQNYAVMHPGAGWRFKCWTPQGYARVVESLMSDWHLPVVLTGSRAEHEGELLREILAECRTQPLNLAGELTLKELGALIAKARFFFGMDSAPMHLAAAVDTPAAVLFGPSGVFNWGPWGTGHLVITKDWECVPCGRDGCQGSKVSRCLVELSPEEVLQRLSEWAAANQLK